VSTVYSMKQYTVLDLIVLPLSSNHDDEMRGEERRRDDTDTVIIQYFYILVQCTIVTQFYPILPTLISSLV